ncbi:hypothetical protein Q1695_007960 [Nippostrongylus brasiliensis]|nr:hypothetical protein Q1695_007960 [Nippostrongylus brasiliensis]
MDQKWKYDLASILRSHKPHQITITCKGSDNGFTAYQQAITARFAQHPVSWKRHGRPFPQPLTFPLRFCAFDEGLCFGPHMTQGDLPNIAFLHMYVIDSASVDEYRTSVRHNVSEWFAKVSTKSDVQWMIVVDSTRAKEKKNRTTLMEKLKHDFCKHTSRLIEVSESVEHGSFMGLMQAVQASLLAHLEILTDTWEASLNNVRDKYMDVNWNLPAFCSSTMEFARLFWSLGAYEHAMMLYDDLDLHLFDIVNKVANVEAGKEPKWVVSIRTTGLPFRSLFSTFEQAKLECRKDHSLISIRHFLVSRQILLSLCQYNARHRSSGAAPSLRVDFAALVLRYTNRVLSIALEQTKVSLMNVPNARLSCWSLIVSSEALHIAGLLADPSSVEGAATALCGIHLQRFFSVLDLAELPESGPSETRSTLCEWLATGDSVGSAASLHEALQSPNLFATHLAKTHESATAMLLQCGRTRQSAHIGWKMAEWLRKNNRDSSALPLELRFVSSLLESGTRSQAVVDVMKHIIRNSSEEIDFERLLSYRLYIAVHDTDFSERKRIARDLLSQITERKPATNIKYTLNIPATLNLPKSLFHASVEDFTSVVQIPDGRVSIIFEVTSSFPIAIPNFCLQVKLREVDEGSLRKRKRALYDVHFSERDQVCRVVTLQKNQQSRSSKSRSKSPHFPVSRGEILLKCSDDLVLEPGKNKIIVFGPADSRGCFLLDNVQATLFNGALAVDINDVKTRRLSTVFVQSTPNKLWIEDTKDLLAGVVQRVKVNIEAGSSIDASFVDVRAESSEGIEFLGANDEWCSSAKISVPSLESGARHTFEIQLCLLMDSALTNSPAVRRVKICCEWMGRVWSLELSFVALLIMTSTTSRLENKTLFELEIARAVGHAEEWTVVLERAVIEAVDPSAALEAPNLLGRLLNEHLEELIPNVVSSLVWVLPLAGELPITHKLFIDYRVKPTKKYDEVYGSFRFLDRLYSYRDAFDLHVPRVGYEICAQMLSQQPGAQLCRAGTACDLVISLRSMVSCLEVLYIVLDADEKLWKVSERAKIIHVKESGLGQLAFSIVPCAAGFLPYPTVSVYSCNALSPRVGESWTEGLDILPGSLLPSFHRTEGKQIRVLASTQTEPEPVEPKKGLKHKLGKLFD